MNYKYFIIYNISKIFIKKIFINITWTLKTKKTLLLKKLLEMI